MTIGRLVVDWEHLDKHTSSSPQLRQTTAIRDTYLIFEGSHGRIESDFAVEKHSDGWMVVYEYSRQ